MLRMGFEEFADYHRTCREIHSIETRSMGWMMMAAAQGKKKDMEAVLTDITLNMEEPKGLQEFMSDFPLGRI